MDPPPSHPKHTQLDLDQDIHDDDDDDEEYQQQKQQQQMVLYKAREMVDATAQDTDNDKDKSAAAAAPSFFRRFLSPSPNAVLSSSFFARPEPLALPRQDNDGLLVLPQPPRVENQSSEQEEQDDDPLAAPLLVPPTSHLSSSSSSPPPWGRSPSRSVKRVLVSSFAVVVMGVMVRWAVLHHGHFHAPPAPVDRYVVLKTCLEDDLKIVPSEGITAWFWNGPGRQVAVSPPCRWDSPLGTLVSLLQLGKALDVGHASWNGQGRIMTEPEDVCHWKGIVCNDEPAVTGLYLNHDVNLSGTLPPQLFGGRRPGALDKLVRLELQDNAGLHGTIPWQLSYLTQLERVYLHETNLSGTIPTTLGQLNRLEELLVDRTQLVGTMPDQICRLRHTARLTNLHASCNHVQCNRQTCCTACHNEPNHHHHHHHNNNTTTNNNTVIAMNE